MQTESQGICTVGSWLVMSSAGTLWYVSVSHGAV
jgi:hypothetical protein